MVSFADLDYHNIRLAVSSQTSKIIVLVTFREKAVFLQYLGAVKTF
jgi:hypothetical protein